MLYLDGEEVGRDRIPNTVAGRFGIDTFGLVADTGSPVGNEYQLPYDFSGSIKQVDVYLEETEAAHKQEEAQLQARFKTGKDY